MFLDKVMRMVAETSLEDAKCPGRELQPGDKVIGTLPDNLKKLYLVSLKFNQDLQSFHEELYKKINDLGENISGEQLNEIKLDNMTFRLKHDLVYQLFLNSLHIEFPTMVESLAVRQNWQVVEIDQKEKIKRSFAEFIDAFLR